MIRFERFARCASIALLFACGLARAQLPLATPVHLERGGMILEGVQPLDEALAARLARYTDSRAAGLLDWLPDGGVLVSTRFGETEQIHRVGFPLGMREQLTWLPAPFRSVVAPPAPDRDGFALVVQEPGLPESSQIFYYRLSGHRATALTQLRGVHAGPLWSRDGKRLAFYATAADAVGHDLFVAEPDGPGAPRLVLAGTGRRWHPLDWSPDGRQLLIEALSDGEGELYLAPVDGGAATPVEPGAHRSTIRGARFDPSGHGLYVLTDAGGEFITLRHLDLATHEWRDLTSSLAWDVEAFDVSADGRYLAYVVNEDGESHLTVLDTQRRLELAPVGLPEGTISGIRFDRTGRRLAIAAESADSPRDVYVYAVEGGTTRWTQSELGPLTRDELVPARLVHYPTWDRVNGQRRMLAAFVYTPRTPGVHPVLIDLHEDPEGQFRPEFDPFVQFVVNELGYAVIAPNVRGSAGYGRTFRRLDDGPLRTDAVRDVGSLLVWISLQHELDAQHVAVMGGSYGGYLALASLEDYNDRLRGGIVRAPISDFVSYLGHVAPERRELERSEYGDERDPRVRDFLARISPANNARAIRRPLLIVQGLADERVPPVDALVLANRLRSHEGTVWYVGLKDQGHVFRDKSALDAYHQIAAQFLAQLAR